MRKCLSLGPSLRTTFSNWLVGGGERCMSVVKFIFDERGGGIISYGEKGPPSKHVLLQRPRIER